MAEYKPLKPNSTVYLCADTGMDMNNSIWWDKYAYQAGPKELQGYWHHVKGLWFKAHACCSGFWYLTMTRADRGYCDVGRTPLQTGTPKGEEGLHSEVDDEINGTIIPFADVLLGRCDYIYFTNGYNDDVSRQYFGFITAIENVNINVARVHFTLDAIQTYGEYFNFGPSIVTRDMQHCERSYSGAPVKQNMNFHPEPFTPAEGDYIFQRMSGTQEIIEKSNFGPYNKLFTVSDVSLRQTDITPNTYYGGLPSFKISPESVEGSVSLGVGVYFLKNRRCATLDLLGSYNAVEHLLYTYMVPEKFTTYVGEDEPVLMGDLAGYIAPDYKSDKEYTLLTPIKFNDDLQTDENADGYEPINLKVFSSPTTYMSITDNQGGSVEVEMQCLRDHMVTTEHYFNLNMMFNMSIAPNCGSCLYVKNYEDMQGGLGSPFVTLWQMPSYAMTPNNSGYNQDYVQAAYLKNSALKYVAVGAVAGLGTIAASAGAVPAGIAGVVAGGTVSQFGAGLATGSITGGINRFAEGLQKEEQAKIKETFGLPKAVGGLAQGFTRFNMNYTGYSYYFVHQRTEIIKALDTYYSIYGYNQNEFRYPRINTRRRWTYVQCPNVNIIDKGHKSAVPAWAHDQIQSRMASGITFWNVRWALMGDGDQDADPRAITSYDDGTIQAMKGHRFVRNYGSLQSQDFIKENMSVVGGYSSDYTDDTGGLLEPD